MNVDMMTWGKCLWAALTTTATVQATENNTGRLSNGGAYKRDALRLERRLFGVSENCFLLILCLSATPDSVSGSLAQW